MKGLPILTDFDQLHEPNAEELFKSTIDELMIAQAKDRLILFSLMEIVIGYMNDKKYGEKNEVYQNELLTTISKRFNLKGDDDLIKAMEWCAEYLKNAKLAVMVPLGGTH